MLGATFGIKSLPNDKFLDWSKLKAFADDKRIKTQKLKFMSERVENIVGKGKKYCLLAFSPIPTMFL